MDDPIQWKIIIMRLFSLYINCCNFIYTMQYIYVVYNVLKGSHVTGYQGWPTSAFLGRQPPVYQVEELHVTIEIIPTRFVQNLQVLIVENCYQLEHVFDLDDVHVGLLPKLELRLIGLQKLRQYATEAAPEIISLLLWLLLL